MTLELYDVLSHLVIRLERCGVRCVGSFAHCPTHVVVDYWKKNGDLGHVALPMPLAVMPSILARRMEDQA